MKTLPILAPGDSVEIVAPASRCTHKQLKDLKNLLTAWELNCLVAEDIFGDDLLCANHDARRLQLLTNALMNQETKAVICARGGYGSMRIIPGLREFTPPPSPKLFLGMSDITALSLYLQQQWQWPTLHASLSADKFSNDSIAAVKSILFAQSNMLSFEAQPLNQTAKNKNLLSATITGGNLAIVQASIGTSWQLDAHNKIIFLEDVGERGYRIDRMLEHMRQANIFKNAAAIVFGDFINGNEPDGSSLIDAVLERFGEESCIPVVKIAGVGHGHTNLPMPLGVNVELQLGENISLNWVR